MGRNVGTSNGPLQFPSPFLSFLQLNLVSLYVPSNWSFSLLSRILVTGTVQKSGVTTGKSLLSF